ncbi:TetR/AcrR family transcriptional regulator [Amycolatopsis anabasis]|uniref:TetR/AcrR family transcriptional regulator n=1 Tax=Amycolatopsis anabasis TaxID=1840409 RepID=UPI001C5550C8|nr:TetR/AcrR family transcriptional regulator [Amycolatopsis anabasis]
MSTAAESSTRSRTRQAIVEAAATVLSQRPKASLADVAAAAGVGRSTLHRYFPERSDLITALSDESVVRMRQAAADAGLDQGTAVEALRRLVHAFFGLGPWLLFLFNERLLEEEETFLASFETANEPVAGLMLRGQEEGVLDPEASIEWLLRVLWMLVYAGWDAVRDGELPRHSATEFIIRALEHGIVLSR